MRLEENIEAGRRMPEEALRRFLAIPGRIILLARDSKTKEIVGYVFGLPQQAVPETKGASTAPLRETFYEMSWQVLPAYQGRGVGSALRYLLRDAVRNAGYKYIASHQNDMLDENAIQKELSLEYAQGDELFFLQKGLPSLGGQMGQQYVVIKLAQSSSPVTADDIGELVRILDQRGVTPFIHGVLGRVLDDYQNNEAMVKAIQKYTVLKNPEDIYRVLMWKKHVTGYKRQGIEAEYPLSGIKKAEAESLFNSIFAQEKFLAGKPINIVLFRRERGGQHLTNLFKSIPNVNVHVIVSGIDDGESWREAALSTGITGVPTAGKTLSDLARDVKVRNFLESRIDDQKEFLKLIQALQHPSPSVKFGSKEMEDIYHLGLRIPDSKGWQGHPDTRLSRLAGYLDTFYNIWQQKGGFSLKNMPVRSMVIVGAAYQLHNDNDPAPQWQKAIDKIAEFLDVKKGNRVILPTEERQHVVALRENGIVHFSEESLTHSSNKTSIVAMWLVNQKMDANFISSFFNVEKIPYSTFSNTVRPELNEATKKIHKERIDAFITAMNKYSSTQGDRMVPISRDTRMALDQADAIITSNVSIEKNIAPVLIIPEMRETIEGLVTLQRLKEYVAEENAGAIFKELGNKGYIDAKGRIGNTFKKLMEEKQFALDVKILEEEKHAVYTMLRMLQKRSTLKINLAQTRDKH